MQMLAFMQNLGMGELIIIFLAVLLIFGPKALPQLGRSLGDAMREFKSATNKITTDLSTSIEDEERRTRMNAHPVRREAALSGPTEGPAVVPATVPQPAQTVERNAR